MPSTCHVRVFGVKDARRVAREIGPLPSSWCKMIRDHYMRMHPERYEQMKEDEEYTHMFPKSRGWWRDVEMMRVPDGK